MIENHIEAQKHRETDRELPIEQRVDKLIKTLPIPAIQSVKLICNQCKTEGKTSCTCH